jgi:hypothetical protein
MSDVIKGASPRSQGFAGEAAANFWTRSTSKRLKRVLALTV